MTAALRTTRTGGGLLPGAVGARARRETVLALIIKIDHRSIVPCRPDGCISSLRACFAAKPTTGAPTHSCAPHSSRTGAVGSSNPRTHTSAMRGGLRYAEIVKVER